jgi:hypothetical protein
MLSNHDPIIDVPYEICNDAKYDALEFEPHTDVAIVGMLDEVVPASSVFVQVLSISFFF